MALAEGNGVNSRSFHSSLCEIKCAKDATRRSGLSTVRAGAQKTS